MNFRIEVLYVFEDVSAAKLCSLKFKMRNYKSIDLGDSRSFSGRVHCTRYQISAGANAPAAPVLDPPLNLQLLDSWEKLKVTH